METTIKDQTALSRTVAGTATLKLANLHSLDAFYTPLEERFERITRLGKQALGVPIVAITVIQDKRQWFKSVVGWQVTELPLAESLCAEVISDRKPRIVENTLDDLVLMSKKLVCKKPRIRFYAGHPLFDYEGQPIGSFCAMDLKTRKVDAAFRQTLADLADMAQRELFSVELSNAHSALIAKLGEARRQAMFDSLTRLWNRRGGESLLQAALKESVHHNHSIGVIMADIDNFKQVNDRFGHGMGDQVLRKVASTIVAAVRPQDIVCRYGGDEFLVIVRDIDESDLSEIAERICEKIHELPIRTRDGTVPASVSIGIAMRSQSGTMSAATLIECADEALYESKRNGRNRVTLRKVNGAASSRN
ncbi:MAG TPA: sensor domain-containing diguanylate cyclase [Woeseiaceae bacterium]|nr:sensor domain-containing diguanylate cyclase [Woeseiaceae bacterium]